MSRPRDSIPILIFPFLINLIHDSQTCLYEYVDNNTTVQTAKINSRKSKLLLLFVFLRQSSWYCVYISCVYISCLLGTIVSGQFSNKYTCSIIYSMSTLRHMSKVESYDTEYVI